MGRTWDICVFCSKPFSAEFCLREPIDRCIREGTMGKGKRCIFTCIIALSLRLLRLFNFPNSDRGTKSASDHHMVYVQQSTKLDVTQLWLNQSSVRGEQTGIVNSRLANPRSVSGRQCGGGTLNRPLDCAPQCSIRGQTAFVNGGRSLRLQRALVWSGGCCITGSPK